MNLTIRLFTILIAAAFLLPSCSKDKMMEIRIQKKDGEWNIDKVNWTVVYQSDSGQVVNSGTTVDAGKFTFDKDGTGSYSYKVDTYDRSGSFKWEVNDKKLTITSAQQKLSFGSFPSIDQKVIAYTGSEPEKNSLVLEGSETEQQLTNGISQFVLTGTFYLSK